MKKIIFLSLIALLLLCTNANYAQAKSKEKVKVEAKPAAPPLAEVDTAKQEKEALANNIANMRNQQLRVAILKQLLNEELSKLRDTQTAFCNQYKLDIEKLRQGLYRYDEKENKFVEIPAEKKADVR